MVIKQNKGRLLFIAEYCSSPGSVAELVSEESGRGLDFFGNGREGISSNRWCAQDPWSLVRVCPSKLDRCRGDIKSNTWCASMIAELCPRLSEFLGRCRGLIGHGWSLPRICPSRLVDAEQAFHRAPCVHGVNWSG